MADKPYVIVRARNAGVHAGVLESRDDEGSIVLSDARRIWYWKGAQTLSEIAVYGCNPDNVDDCKFAPAVERQEVLREDACEIIHCQPEGEAMIRGAKAWRA